jgi:hypothetical protein
MQDMPFARKRTDAGIDAVIQRDYTKPKSAVGLLAGILPADATLWPSKI